MKKQNFMKILLEFIFLPLLLLGLSACGEENVPEYITMTDSGYINTESTAVVLILGNHANAMALPPDAYSLIETSLDKVVYGGYICAIVADGTPAKRELIDSEDFFREDAQNDLILNDMLRERKAAVSDALKTLDLTADSPEADLLAAIREAKNVLSSSKVSEMKNKEIFIIDTGISTAGDLNFLNIDFLKSRPESQDIISRLNAYEGFGVLPDLSGIQVTFCGTADGLAEPAAPQQMSTTDKRFVKELWRELATACKADEVRFESVAGWDTPNVYTEDSASKFPYVSVVAFSHEPLFDFSALKGIDPSDPDTQPNLPAPPVVEVKIPSKVIGFQPNMAEYLDEPNANKTLSPYAEDLKEFFRFYPNEKIWIVGTTATVRKGGDGSIDLSLKRAQKIKEKLVEFDVPEENMVTLGLGAKFPWAVDSYQNGSFDTEIAQENRAVWLLTATEDSGLFNKLMTAYYNKDLLPEAVARLDTLME